MDKDTSNGDKPRLSLHKLPCDEELRKKWIAAISRDNWTPTHNTRLCSKHFWPHDFQGSTDSNASRKRKREEDGIEVRQSLRANAVPSRFPSLPFYLPKKVPATATTHASENDRLAMEIAQEEQEQPFVFVDVNKVE